MLADEAPGADTLTGYDEEHLITYRGLLDAEHDGAEWDEAALLILSIDPIREPARARRVWMAARIRINLAEDAGWPLRRANRQDFWRAGQSAAVSTAAAFLQLFSLTAFCL